MNKSSRKFLPRRANRPTLLSVVLCLFILFALGLRGHDVGTILGAKPVNKLAVITAKVIQQLANVFHAAFVMFSIAIFQDLLCLCARNNGLCARATLR